VRVDVVIIGGGAVGSAAAYFLRSHRRACSVAVIERDSAYKLASTPRASGGVRRLFSLPENIALSNFSIPFFERFDSDMAVGGEAAAINFRKGGYLFIVPPASVHDLERNFKVQKANGVNVDWLDRDGLKVIDILAHHPSTAKFISLGLARHFVAENPPQALVDRMAQTFTKTDGDLRAVMETMFRSPEFLSEAAWESRVKSPLEMAASTIRALGGEMTDAFATVQKVSEMGQMLYAKLEPTGYPDVAETWLGATAVIARMNFGAAVASGQVPGVSIDASRWQGMDSSAIAKALLGHEPSPQTLEALATGLEGRNPSPAVVASLVLGSPDFERR